MVEFVFTNNVSTTLAAPLSSTATTLTIASTANLPTITAGSVMALTLNDAATRSVYEIVYVTAIDGFTLTVIRGQEGIPAKSWSQGDFVYSGPTAGQMQSLANINGSTSEPFSISNLTASTGVFSNVAVFTTTGASVNGSTIAWANGGNWTIPPGVSKIKVISVGGGGGGGGSSATSSTQQSVAPGGNSGSAGFGIYSVTAGTNYAVTVGGGGTGGSGAGTGSAGSGGASSFGALLNAPGGTGAPNGPQTSASTGVVQAPAANDGIVATGGYLNLYSIIAQSGVGAGSAGNNNLGGAGAPSPLGSGGGSFGINGAGKPGVVAGAGGGGASSYPSSSAFFGGDGASGIVLVMW